MWEEKRGWDWGVSLFERSCMRRHMMLQGFIRGPGCAECNLVLAE